MKNLCGAALLAFAGISPAQAFTYTETTDLPGGSGFGTGSVSVGSLTVGSNTIIGSLNGQCVATNYNYFDCNPGLGGGDSQDSFLFTVPSGLSTSSLTITTSSALAPAGFGYAFELRSMTSNIITKFNLQPNGSTSINFGMTSQGIYSASIFGGIANADGPYKLAYTIAIDGAAVPETSTWALMIAGVGAVGYVVRRLRDQVAVRYS